MMKTLLFVNIFQQNQTLYFSTSGPLYYISDLKQISAVLKLHIICQKLFLSDHNINLKNIQI